MSDLPPPPSFPPPPVPPPPGPAPLESVGPGRRLGARFIDGLILFIPSLIVAVVVGGDGAFQAEVSGPNILAGILTTILSLAYSVYFEASRGWTPGKKLLSIRVVGPDGNLPTQEAALRRNLFEGLGAVPVLGNIASVVAVIAIWVTIARDPFNRGWHDNFAGGTAVVFDR